MVCVQDPTCYFTEVVSGFSLLQNYTQTCLPHFSCSCPKTICGLHMMKEWRLGVDYFEGSDTKHMQQKKCIYIYYGVIIYDWHLICLNMFCVGTYLQYSQINNKYYAIYGVENNLHYDWKQKYFMIALNVVRMPNIKFRQCEDWKIIRTTTLYYFFMLLF